MPEGSDPTSPSADVTRRAVLGGIAAASASAAALPALGQAVTPQALIQAGLGEGQPFSAAAVTEIARQLARRSFVAPPNDLPDGFSGLNYEQYVRIRPQPSTFVWAGENRGFVAEPLHRGFVFTNQVGLFTVEDGLVRRIAYDRSRFDFGGLPVPATVPDLGFSGVRLYTTFGNGQYVDFAILQGATFFRSIARGQNFGVVSRALTLKPAEARGEEFPIFRAFWLERPNPGTGALVIHGVIDSESTSGAVRMTFRPGDVTINDVELTLFPRVNLDHLGLAGMGASYLFGPNDRGTNDDVRPAVYEVGGLQMLNGSGEWLWRPLHNPETLQISAFIDRSPRGFGLAQRDRDFAAFQDDEQRLENRPTLWVEPLGDWGQGQVQLIEIPSNSEVNDNVLAYWRPRAPVPAGSEAVFAYRQFWCWTPPDRPPLATVAATRVGRGSAGRRRRFVVDFVGDMLPGIPAQEIRPALTAGPGALHAIRVFPTPHRRAVRVSFELDPGSENASEMRLVLEAGGKPISETWLYRWTP